MPKNELEKRLPIERAILKLIPSARRAMISEIELVNKAWYQKRISPFKLAQFVRDLIRDGLVYQPREGYYKRA